MFKVYECFNDGKMFLLYEDSDLFNCECWRANHATCTNALRLGKSILIITHD